MEKYGVQHESWGPFTEDRKDMFSHSGIKAIGEQYGKTVAQVILRFLIQNSVVVIPKSAHKERMSGDRNIISLIAAKIAAFLFYGIKFLSKPNDKNFIPFPILTRILSHS
ncbi:hypothetical protein [Paenibacillus kribbensis]|uniref:hypothetical protein n=1 Tax=Paenibacillus kribbensis TaxID=172713 RepID=UPI0015BACF78|nr:hypothetical protein [Paenibacillus kribbensis]